MKAFATILGLDLLGACSHQPAPGNTAVDNAHGSMSHDAMTTPTAGDSAATRGFKQSMAGMMSDAPPYTGDSVKRAPEWPSRHSRGPVPADRAAA